MTKIRLRFIVFAVSLVVVLMPAALVHAEGEDAATSTAPTTGDEVTISDLGVEKAGLLPTNPFYFIKEWGRGARLFFASDPVKKAELELRVVNEKAAELKQVDKNDPQDEEALQRAIDNYSKNVLRLRIRLEALKETSENPKIDELLNRLTERAVKHEELFENLKERHAKLKDKIESAQDGVDETVNAASEKLDKPDKSKERLNKALKGLKNATSTMSEVKALNFLNRLGEKASSTEAKERLKELREEAVKKVDEKIKRGESNTSTRVKAKEVLEKARHLKSKKEGRGATSTEADD